MTGSPYADVADLVAALPADSLEDVDTDDIIRDACNLIDDKVRAPYPVDATTKLPTDDTIAEALRDATCAQVQFWLETGVEHDIDGLAGTTYSVPGYSGTRPPVLAPRARRALNRCNLLGFTSTVSSGGWW